LTEQEREIGWEGRGGEIERGSERGADIEIERESIEQN